MLTSRVSKYFYIFTVLFMPVATSAQAIGTRPGDFGDLIGLFINILSLLIPLLFGIALVGFLYGVVKFILNSGNPSKKEEGRTIMLWGIIGLFVMISVWGLVSILTNTFGISLIIPLLPGS